MNHLFSVLRPRALTALLTLLAFFPLVAAAQTPSPSGTLHGSVIDASGTPIAGAIVQLQSADGKTPRQTTSSADGGFSFSSLPPGAYTIRASKAARHSSTAALQLPAPPGEPPLHLVLAGATAAPAMQFSDAPSFAISGVTDWTAIGGHGSDSILRTSESLARDTVSLPPQHTAAQAPASGASEQTLLAALAHSPGDFAANHQLGAFYLHAGRYREAIPLLESAWRLNPSDAGNVYDLSQACAGAGDLQQARQHVSDYLAHHDSADLHRLAAELAEKSNDPLEAVRQFELAAHQDPSEQNYFEWGSELLLHRAVWQALEVLQKGVAAWPKSARLQTALGATLFAAARYDDAATRLCAASDLSPANPEPYIFMGKIEMAAPHPLPCIAPKLQRFLAQQPQNSEACYLNAMTLLKQSPDPQSQQQAESLLHRAVQLDPHNADAWLQLGILSAAGGRYPQAIPLYQKAIDADPRLSDAHYRLAVAYDRTGQAAQARQEFQLHDQIDKEQAAAVERQRKQIKQFLITPPARAATAPQ